MANLNPTPLDALHKAVKTAGSRAKLAKLIGHKNTSHINIMINRDKRASTKYVLKIHQVTGVPLHELRPDLYALASNDASNSPDIA